jgi:hypothetical protein
LQFSSPVSLLPHAFVVLCLTMSSRSRKSIQRDNLYRLIVATGFDVMPCSFCSSRHLKCRMTEEHSRCAECVRRGRSCDAAGVPLVSVNRIIDEKRRIEREEEEVESELLHLQQQVAERFARLARLRRQRKTIVSKGHEMVRRGLRSLDSLEEAEREESEAVVAVQSSGGFGVVDWNAVFGDDFIGPDLPEPSAVVDGIVSAGAVNSSGV